MRDQDDEYDTRRDYRAPYTSHRPIPTIQQYRNEKEARRTGPDAISGDAPPGVDDREDDPSAPYLDSASGDNKGNNANPSGEDDQQNEQAGTGAALTEDTSEARAGGLTPKQKRKAIGKRKDERAERVVTDPITHLPARIHDLQSSDLRAVPENEPPPGSNLRTATGLSNKSKSDSQLASEEDENHQSHKAMQNLFPTPSYDRVRSGLARIYSSAIAVALVSAFAICIFLYALEKLLFGKGPTQVFVSEQNTITYTFGAAMALGAIGLLAIAILIIRKWTEHQVQSLWDNEVWEAERERGKNRSQENQTPEWLNSILHSIWPLVNPDLFKGLSDTLEDVMQASLPSVVRMVSIEDMGQGSESIRILGVRWLPTGAAARSVTADGKLESMKASEKQNDRSVPGQGEVDENAEEDQEMSDDSGKQSGSEAQQEQEAEGMEAEEGDFMNIELALAYRARSSQKKFRNRAKHAHLLMAFYLPGNIKIPVYVDVRGFLAIMRLRLQLTPDPPFLSLCTLTFLGQPKVEVGCVPLTSRGLNIMDLPLISNFVQSSVDAAAAEYVAPKSMTIDLKDMLAGEDFKKDTRALGVIVVTVKRAYDFTTGDPSIPMIKDGSADPYVTVAWAKFVRPLWSTRVILSEMQPQWEETAYVLVTQDELNVHERLRVQLWDSDRFTADDDLGRIELGLKDLMENAETKGRMFDRTDGFKALKAEERMPGKLEWAVGYFEKAHIQDAQLKQQMADSDVRTKRQLVEKVKASSQRKLREAKKDEHKELKQLEAQQLKETEDQLIIAAPPLEDYPSGILSIQIHEVTGLEVRAMHNQARSNDISGDEASDEEEEGGDLPSAYCNIIINHQKIYRTRVKPKNAKPFFNAGTERFIRDWRNTEVFITVRDARVHEDDALLGLVRLPLGETFKQRCQVNNAYPLSGGMGYGRVRVSLVFRSVTLQLPRNELGWDWGTLVIQPEMHGQDLPQELHSLRLKIQTSLTTTHMWPHQGQRWASRHSQKLHLAVRERYSSVLVIQFRTKTPILKDKTSAFCVLWLQDLTDGAEETLTLPVWKGDLKRATTCRLSECGERVGAIRLTLSFCAGLSKYHLKAASRDRHLKDVMDVVNTARNQEQRDAEESRGALRDPGSADYQSDESVDSSTSESNGDEGDDDGNSKDLQQDGDRNILDSIKDYKDHRHQKHRQHRGVMQHKSARTMWWMKHKVEHMQNRLSGVFDHHERKTGIESEA